MLAILTKLTTSKYTKCK